MQILATAFQIFFRPCHWIFSISRFHLHLTVLPSAAIFHPSYPIVGSQFIHGVVSSIIHWKRRSRIMHVKLD
ncbi:hypothetical protein BYT27DRAFT_6873279 [Phlegmacium glaucopus]|nr:hypothetical protein BYT27DRAFT_6873279 [Phlegmacium glaucopus]